MEAEQLREAYCKEFGYSNFNKLNINDYTKYLESLLSEVAPKQNAIVEDRECLCTISDIPTATIRDGACYCGNCDGKLWEISTNDRVAPKQEQEVINQFTLGEMEGTFYVVKEDEDYVVCESDYKEWAEKIIETLNKEQKFPLCGD